MEKPLISVIVPVYNVEKTIRKCVDSILNQTYTNLELLLVDDGSKDSSADICKEFSKTDLRVRYIYKTNGGVSSARNLGIKQSLGDFVMFVDSDDWIENQTIDRLLEVLNQTRAEIAFPQMQIDIFDNNGRLSEIRKSDDIDEFTASSDQIQSKFEVIMKSGLLFSASGRLYKRDFLIDNNICFDEDIKLLEDFAFNLKCLLFASRIVHIHYIAYHFYVKNLDLYAYKRSYVSFIDGIHNAWSNIAKLLDEKRIPYVPYYSDFLLGYWGMALESLFVQEKSWTKKYKAIKKIAREVQNEKLLNCFTYGGLSSKHRLLYKTASPCVFFVVDYLHTIKERMQSKNGRKKVL